MKPDVRNEIADKLESAMANLILLASDLEVGTLDCLDIYATDVLRDVSAITVMLAKESVAAPRPVLRVVE